MTHHITWDHDECEHDPDPQEHWCSPQRAEVTCDDPGCIHRLVPDAPPDEGDAYDDGWWFCEGGQACAAPSDWEEYWRVAHEDPGVPHTTRGHVLKDTGDCNAAVTLSEEMDLGGYVKQHRDGPVVVMWLDGYEISYPDEVKR